MVKILEHFGEPSVHTRTDPQQLLALPCNMCDPAKLTQMAKGGVTEDIAALGRRQRADIHVGVRALEMKQVVERIGPEIQMLEGFYALAAVQLPQSLEDIDASGVHMREAHRRRELYNQIDLCITACCEHPEEEAANSSLHGALGASCGVEISANVWSDFVQSRMRKKLGVPFPIRVQAADMEVTVVILPDDCVASKIHGVLCFTEPLGASYADQDSNRDEFVPTEGSKVEAAREDVVAGKTVSQWEVEQERDFPGQPKLPSGWLRVRSRTTGDVYYFNKQTKESTYDPPEVLPAGWTKQVSRSSGKTYYFHAQRNVSTFERPRS